ncbi:oxidoreductase FAD-binding subunit [Variovorax sp. WS11]|uniref:2Fe-2S iron-sulfur cluster binding domain-containing protein n=1 Tax=Variovorax sp. WS11 TaxID=1105204 RepID=UPI000D0DD6BB|nr:2Fe-2S iron-sulfur cluster binding domain-containing protein [Variovorax sp. WS11]NDZ17403.1 2Fe-2S iron-sulfur cluster binding domain-containing protein [Variovorax sp. WS11]PSL86060.1 oxidoreductase FAD-binding subunit [Variovorax sp. WS11]
MNPIDPAVAGRTAFVRLEPSGARLSCAAGQTVLAAALAAGIDLPYECASGSCGSCRVRLVEGSVSPLWAGAPGLSERDRRKGDRILCCQSIVHDDCAIQVQPHAGTPPVRPARWRTRVRELRPLNRNVVHLVLEAEHAVDFLPGQFMLFELPHGIGRRAYSMANLPGVDGQLEFIIKRKPGGLGCNYLFDALHAGDAVHLEGPYGRAWLREDGANDIVLLAGGSGLAPIWSIAQAALRRWPQRRLRLYFGANRAEDLFWLEEIEQARRVMPALEANLVLVQSSAADPPGARTGLVGAVMSQDIGNALSNDLYLAGPPGLIDSVLRDFVATGRARADRVFFDRFL